MDTLNLNKNLEKLHNKEMSYPGTLIVKMVLIWVYISIVLTKTCFASIEIGSYTFGDASFPDAANYISGGPASFNFTTTGNVNDDFLLAAGPDTSNYSYGVPVTFELDFDDPSILGDDIIQNNIGADLVLFELGALDAIEVSVHYNGIWATAQYYMVNDTGFDVGNLSLNAVEIDLDDFGVSNMDTVHLIKLNTDSYIGGGQTISASVCAVGALNVIPEVPEPTTMFIFGLGSILALRRKRKI